MIDRQLQPTLIANSLLQRILWVLMDLGKSTVDNLEMRLHRLHYCMLNCYDFLSNIKYLHQKTLDWYLKQILY